jgi:hypothetical protein
MTEEFVQNPSKITKHLVNIVLKLNKKHETSLKGILNRFKTHIAYNLYLRGGYKEYYFFLKNYKVKSRTLKQLFQEFENQYNKLLFNNFALVYAYTKEKQIENPILTKEDEKILLLKTNLKKLKSKFGHYALNAYELKEKRFSEYSDKELKKLSNLVKNLEIKNKIPLESYLKKKDKKPIPILIALRELAKYNILKIVAEIREQLLKTNKANIFNKSYKEIISLT